MKKCCLFDFSEEEFKERKDFEDVKYYGEIDSPDQCKRELIKCKNCGALFLYQFLDWNDSYYDDFIQVENELESDNLNHNLDKFNNFFDNDKPMIKVGSDNKAHYILPKSMLSAKEIIEVLSNKDQDKLK